VWLQLRLSSLLQASWKVPTQRKPCILSQPYIKTGTAFQRRLRQALGRLVATA